MLADHIGIPQLRDLASRSEQVSEAIHLDSMSRLGDLLHADADLQALKASELEVQLKFLGGIHGFPEISGQLKGSLEICCQRCLGLLKWPIELEFHLVIVGSEADIRDDLAEHIDVMAAGEHGIQLTEVIQDEILSSLPLAPMHEDAGNCELPEIVEIISEAIDADETEMNNPFEGLADLIKDGRSSDTS
jgi:uncharacterized protein